MTDTHFRHEVAPFRYGLIAEFVPLPPHRPGLYRRRPESAKTTVCRKLTAALHPAP